MRKLRYPHAAAWLERSDEGSATAEFAVVLPAVIVIVSLIFYMSGATVRTMQCQDEAANLARQILVADDPSSVALSPSRSGFMTYSLHDEGHAFEVVTQCSVLPDPLGVLPKIVKGHASAVRQE